MEVISYNLDDIRDIIFSGFNYKLPENIINNIETLSNEVSKYVSSQPMNKTEDTKSKLSLQKRGGSNRRYKSSPDEEKWEKKVPFKTTKIEKKEGVEKLMDDIRISLNKISSKNYDTHKDAVIDYIKQVVEFNENELERENDLQKITKYIFDIASSNKFYSELYAELYKELISEFPEFHDIVVSSIKEYMDNIENIKYIDPKVDYDKHCDNNKENDKRRAISAFLVNLAKSDVIKKEDVMHIITYLQLLVFDYVNQEGKSIETEEIIENLFILITTSVEIFPRGDTWNIILENSKKLSSLKPKELISFSSRALFKCMDILDYLKKRGFV